MPNTLFDNSHLYPLAIPNRIYGSAIAYNFPKQEKNRKGHYAYIVVDGMANRYYWKFQFKRGSYAFVVFNRTGDITYAKEDVAVLTETNLNDFVVQQLKDYLSIGLTYHEVIQYTEPVKSS